MHIEATTRVRTGAALMTIAAMLLAGAGMLPDSLAIAQDTGATGVIAGSVTADHGDVRALRVKAHDTVQRIAYTVYTQDGRYRIFNLPPSTYDVTVIEEAFESPTATVEVSAGATTTVDIALAALGAGPEQGAAARGASAQRNYGGGAADDRAAEIVDFDTLYPPHPARDVMLRSCFGCHGPAGFHRRGPRNERGWRAAVDRMFDIDGRVANMAPGVPQITHDLVSVEEKDLIIEYLTANFGPGSTPRDLELDPLIRDEEALSEAVYIEYELNRGPRRLPSNGAPTRGSIHSVFASRAEPGVIWVSGNGSNSIIRMDSRDADFETRTQELWIENPEDINVTPHGIVEYRGRVYWVELTGDHFGELDPATGEMKRYPMPTKGGGPHSVWVDSRGSFWYTYFASAGRIGRFDLAAQDFTEWEPLAGFSGYGIVVDRQDRVWAVGLHTPAIYMYNQETAAVAVVPAGQPGAAPRHRRQRQDLGGALLRQRDLEDRPRHVDRHRVHAAAQGRQSLRRLAGRRRQPLGRERHLQLAGPIRPEDRRVHLLPVPGAAGAHPEAGPRRGGHTLVHPARAVRTGRGGAQAARQRAGADERRPVDTPGSGWKSSTAWLISSHVVDDFRQEPGRSLSRRDAAGRKPVHARSLSPPIVVPA